MTYMLSVTKTVRNSEQWCADVQGSEEVQEEMCVSHTGSSLCEDLTPEIVTAIYGLLC